MAVVLAVGAATPLAAGAADQDDADLVAQSIAGLAARLDELALDPLLGTRLPMTLQSPASLLGFPTLFTDSLGTVDDTDLSSDTALATALQDLAITDATGTTVAINETTRVWTVTIDLAHSTDATIPLLYLEPTDESDPDATPGLSLTAGEIAGVSASVSGTLVLEVDPSVTDPSDPTVVDVDRAVSLSPGSTIDFSVIGTDRSVVASSTFGLAAVEVSGSGALDLSAQARFIDPDGTGGITQEEWQTTLMSDLGFVVSTGDDDPDLDIDLRLDADLVDGSSDGTLAVEDDVEAWEAVDGSLEPQLTPTLTPSIGLAPFANVTVEDALASLAQYATAVQALQGSIDVPLPFVDARLGTIASPAAQVMEVVERQAAAAVVCGKVPTSPPTGADLAGTTWYCQGFANEDPTAVTWSLDGSNYAFVGSNDSGTSALGTLGVSPTTQVVIEAQGTEDGTTPPDLSVDFTISDDAGNDLVVTADRRFRTAAQLATALGDVLGDATVAYDAATASLTWDVSLTTNPAAAPAAFDIGDLLRTPTHLAGLEGTGTPVSVDLGAITLDAGFGVMMQTTVPDAETRGDRYYFVTAPSGPELAVASVAATLGSDSVLEGRVGYLGVDATASSSEFAIGGNDGDSTPAMSAEVTAATNLSAGTGTIAGAIRFSDLIADPDASMQSAFNLRGVLELDVAPADGLSLGLDSSDDTSVTVTWDDYPGVGADITMGAEYSELLYPLDVAPTIDGTYLGADGEVDVDAPHLDLYTAFGEPLEAGDTIPRVLTNLTSGATCVGIEVVDSDTMRCADAVVGASSGLQGANRTVEGTGDADTPATADNRWVEGDRWIVEGDPDALRDVLLDALTDLASRLASSTEDDFTSPLPLVGLSPKALTPQLPGIVDALAQLRGLPDDPGASGETADGVPEADTGPAAPEDLQELLTALDDSLSAVTDVDATGVAPSLTLSTNLTNPGTVGDDLTDQTGTHLELRVGVPVSDQETEAPIRLDLGDDSTLGAAAGLDLRRDRADLASTLLVTSSSTVQLDVAVPVDPTIPIRHVLALDTAGISSMDVAAGSDDVSFTGSLGALTLVAGTGADLTGTHVVPSGTHTGATAVASGTHVAETGTASGATTPDVVGGATTDLQVGDTVTRDSDDLTCEVTGVDASSFDCSLSSDWTSGDAWTATTMATLVPSADPSDDVAGMVLRRGAEACSLDSDDLADCGLTGWAPDAAWEIHQGLELQDTTRSGATGFDTLVTVTPPAVRTSITTQRLGTGDAAGTVLSTCTTDGSIAITATILPCDGLETSGGADDTWALDDPYALVVGDPTTTLYDPATTFEEMDLVGATLTNTTDDASCVVASATAQTLVCQDALDGDGRWDAGDAYLVEGIGEARMHLDEYELTATTAAIPDYVADLGATRTGLDVTCGARTDHACAELSLMVPAEDADARDRYLGRLRWSSDIDGNVTAVVPTLSDQAKDALAGEEPIQFSLLSAAFQALKAAVAEALEGTLVNEPLPLVGLDVSAGARLLEAIDLAEQEIAANAPAALTTTTDLAAMDTLLTTWITDALASVEDLSGGVLLELLDPTTETGVADAVEVTFWCGEGEECDPVGDDHTLAHVTDATVAFAVGNHLAPGETVPGDDCDNCDGSTLDLGFDIGLDGLPIETDARLEARVGWSLPVSLGISRSVGPYLDVSGQELELDALVQLPEGDTECPALPAGASGFSSSRCLQATIGLFQGVMWDGADPTDPSAARTGPDDEFSDQTQLTLETSLDLDQEADGGRISAASVLGGELPTLDFSLLADGNVDLYFRTGLDLTTIDGSLPEVEGLPSVQGGVHITYAVDGGVMLGIESEGTGYSGDITFDRLILDAGSFFTNFVSPIAQEIQTYTKPIKPVIDILYTPIPVISDVSKMTGNGEVKPIDVLRAATGSDLTMLERVIEIILFADQVLTYAAQGYVPLGEDDGSDTIALPDLPQVPADAGKFAVSPKGSRKGDCGGKNADGSLKSKNCETTYKKGGTTGTTKVKQLSSCGQAGDKPCTGKELTRTVSTRINKPKVIPGGLTFPVMNDASQVFGMLLGESDAVLVRFDAGTLVASAGLSVSFGPFMAGPVPIDISVGANFSLSGRLVLGYDTRGITNTLKQDPSDFNPAALLDGIFIDDLDLAGTDVPEITVAVTATLAASVSVKIFKVGLEGGVTLTIEFNLNDPDHDGRMRIDEILTLAAADPICLFDVRGTLGFFLGFFVEIDLFVKTVRWSKTLFRMGPYELFEISCTPEPPALATVVDDPADVDSGGDLRLNIGPNVGARNYAEDKAKERYLVRQVAATGPGGTRVSIEAFGLYQEFTVPAGGHIWGDAGSDNDQLRFEPGMTVAVDEDGDVIDVDGNGEPDPVPFTLDVHVDGGAANDKVVTGEGDDRVSGGPGNDTLQTGLGDDTALGGGGNDNIAGGQGDDVLEGGGDDDIVSGEQGRDVVAGGAGDDDLGGGPGLEGAVFDALLDSGRVTASQRTALTDAADVLWGGDGADRMRGHVGADVLFGDELLGFATTPSGVGELAAAFTGGTLDGWTSRPGDGTSDACTADGTTGGGDDSLEGEVGDDLLFGGDGADTVTGGPGDDLACGNDGRDVVDGDTATGATGDDEVDGGSGNDRVFGRGGHDRARGGAGDDLVDTGVGNDVLVGGAGRDTLVAGGGNDVAMGDDGTVTATVDASFPGGLAALDAGGITAGGEDGAAGDQPVAPVTCTDRAAVRGGRVDVDGDGDTDGDDDGWFVGFAVVDGYVNVDGDSTADGTDAGDADVVGEVGIVNGRLVTADVILPGALSGTSTTDADCVLGDQGDDVLFGNAGDDVVHGGVGDDAIGGNGGSDWLRAAQGRDTVHGGAGPDTIFGDSGDDTLLGGPADLTATDAIDGADVIDGGSGADDIAGNAAGDILRGGAGPDVVVGGSADSGQPDGGDAIDGGAADDLVAGDNATVLRGDDGSVVGVTLLDVPVVGGPTVADVGGGDTIQGGDGVDVLHGQQGGDVMRGGRHVDAVSGGDGVDVIHGEAGDDHLVGGSSTHHVVEDGSPVLRELAGVADDGDEIDGGTGADRIAGDNARVLDSGAIEPFDVPLVAGDAVASGVAGGDTIVGGDDADTIRGQSGDDVITGGGASDDIEGNAGADRIHGQQDADVVIGGSRLAGVHDDGDTLVGGGDADLVLGDNADVTGDGPAVERSVVLHDVPGTDPDTGVASPGGDTAGDDLIWGDDDGSTGAAGADRVYGQADDDTIHGQGGDDDLQGNAGADTVYGEDGEDHIVGGSASDQSGPAGVDQPFSGVADAGDDLAGGGGRDWIAGDNAVIADGLIVMADVPDLAGDLPAPGVAGRDRIYGDQAPDGLDESTQPGDVDVLRGQSDDDLVHGQDGDDDIEGNAGADTLHGDAGADDIVGGSRTANVLDEAVDGDGDWIAGGAGTDWIAGDNALLVRGDGSDRTIVLHDVPIAGIDQPDIRAAGGDVVFGDVAGDDLSGDGAPGAADVVYGQSGDDAIDGQEGDDTIDGNAGADVIDGGLGDDALVGGSSADDAVDATDAVVPDDGPGAGRHLLVGVLDGTGDEIDGGAGVDVVLGDNGVVAGHGVGATWRLHDVVVAGQSLEVDPSTGGDDLLTGGTGTDVVLGQAGNDRIAGDGDDDSLHGGPGADVVRGDAGADDIVGGSSHHWVGDSLVELRTVVDGDDVLFGNGPAGDCLAGLPDTAACGEDDTDVGVGDLGDVVVGDNGHVSRDGGTDSRVLDPTRDDNTNDPVRSVLLYDVDVMGGASFPDDASGVDVVFGAAGRDRIFGQADGDTLFGHQGDDEIEGNGGDDRIVGSDGSDDLIGGSSSDTSGLVQAGPFPTSGTDVADGGDTIEAGSGDDVALGDNGIVQRPVDGEWQYHDAPYLHVKRSTVEVAFGFERTGAFGDDTIDAGDGHDDVRGQLGNDTMHGRGGDDTLIGDLGRIRPETHDVILTPTRFETLPADALNEPVYVEGSLRRDVELYETQDSRDPEVSTSLGTGDDTITGGAGNDAIHAGSGADTVHGHGDIADDGVPGSGPDADAVIALDVACAGDESNLACDSDDIFAGHGDDDVWGGPGHDRLFGGHNADDLDVIRAAPTSPQLFGNPDVDYVGIDLIFGGWGQDAMQADQSVNGPDPGDRLIDSAGAYNAYFVCGGGYGDFTAMRRLDPAKITFLDSVATAAGAYAAASSGSSGWWSLANIFHQDVRHNTNPVHPENPGNFVCNEPTEAPEPTGPVAAFSWSCTDLACTFTDESTVPDGTVDTAWTWDLGEGVISNDQETTHTFAGPDAYAVSLTITADGVADTITQQVRVGDVPADPLTLMVAPAKIKGERAADLAWEGAASVSIERDGAQIVGEVTGGSYQDPIGGKGSGAFTYRVCDTAEPSRCSDEVVVTF